MKLTLFLQPFKISDVSGSLHSLVRVSFFRTGVVFFLHYHTFLFSTGGTVSGESILDCSCRTTLSASTAILSQPCRTIPTAASAADLPSAATNLLRTCVRTNVCSHDDVKGFRMIRRLTNRACRDTSRDACACRHDGQKPLIDESVFCTDTHDVTRCHDVITESRAKKERTS